MRLAKCGSGIGAMGAGSTSLPFVATPADVAAEKARLAPLFVATNADVAACAAFAPNDIAAWNLVFVGWLVVLDKPVMSVAALALGMPISLYQVQTAWVEVESYSAQLASWQAKLQAAGCTLSAPQETVTPPEETPAAQLSSAVKWAGAAVIVAAVVYGVTRVV